MRITRKWALTLFLIVSMLLTTPGIGVALAAGEATAARVDVTIAAGETAEVVIVMKSANLAGISSADAIGTLKAQATATQAAAIETVTANGGIVENTFWINNSVVARVDAATLAKVARAPNVDYIIPNFTVTAIENEKVAAATAAAAATPAANTWGLDYIGAPAAWGEYGVNGTGVKIAVLDTGIDTGIAVGPGIPPGTFSGHPDLAGKLFSVYPSAPWFPGGWMTWKPDGTIGNGDGTPNPDIIKKPYDSAQHGTHVAGTIAGGAASGTRIGVAPGAQLMMGLVLPGGSGTFAQVIAGMTWAIAPYDKMGGPAGAPADIVSMSLGATGYYAAFIPAIEAIRAVGCIPVMAIGNEGPGTSGGPGNIWHAMGIGAVDNAGTVGSFSGGEVVYKSDFAGAPAGWGAPSSWIKPEFSAPGVGIMSSVPVGTGPGGTNYDTWNGTSMATPHVAGALALMVQYKRLHPTAAGGVDIGTMFDALRDSAFDPPWSTPGQDTSYGLGIINVRNAISVLRGGTIAPKIEAIPGWPDPIKVAADSGADFTLTINNKGTAPLSFNLTEQPIGGPARAGSTTVLSESAAPSAAGNAKAAAGGKASSYKYSVSSMTGPRILVYTDDYFLSAGNTYVDQALVALGLSYTGFYSDRTGFNTALTTGGPWDLVLLSENNYYSSANYDAINTYVLGGGKAIIETWAMGYYSSNPLWNTMGVVWRSEMGSPENLYRWFPGDPVFNSPDSVPDMVPTETSYSDDGDKVDPVGGVEPLAGFTPGAGPDQSGIIRSSHGYVNSFIVSDFRGDDDADGKVDAVELWINEIANISGAAADVTWLSEDPITGSVPAGGSVTVSVSVNAGGLDLGFYGAILTVNSNDPTTPSLPFPVHMEVSGAPVIGVSPMDPLTFVINKGEQANRDNAFTIYNTGGGDLFVNISDQFAKGTGGTSASASGASNLPAPEAGPARTLPGNGTVSASGVKPSTGPGADGRMFSGDKLNIGVSNFGELDWRTPTPGRPDSSWMGYGFEYKPQAAEMAAPAESTAIGWNGEGYVVYYDGRAIAEYPDFRTAGIVPTGADVLMDTPETLKYRVSTQTDDGKLQVNFIINFNKHSRAVNMTTEFINIGPSFIGEIKYKRVVDWDAGASAGNDINWHYNSDLSILSTVDPPSGSGKYYAYGFGAMGDSWPMVYDYDLNAWDDYSSIDHGSTWQQADVAGPFDGNVAMYFAVGPLGPGERKQVNTVYIVGEGADAASAYVDMLTNLGGGKAGDVPWLDQTPSKPVVHGSGAAGVDVSVDGRGLAPGRYFANIVINHNDPGCPPILIPVQVVVNAAFKSIISDPEDVNPIPPAPPAPKMDIDRVFVQITKTSIQFNTMLFNVTPGDKPLVLMTMMDTGKGVGYTGPGSNDIMANYMLFGFIYPAGPGPAASKAIASADLSAYSKVGLSASNLAPIRSSMVKAAAGTGPTGQLFLFKWDDPSKTWAPLMETYAIGMNSEAGTPGTFNIWQLTYLPLMYSDGAMKVVQSAGDMWELVDIAPDRGHGATVPARDIAVSGVDAVAAADAAPTFLTGQTVNITASVANNGDEAERDLPVDFQVIPVLGERATEPGEPGYPAPALTLGTPIDLGSSIIEVINPGDTGTATVAWTPELIAAALSRSKVKAAVDPWIHSYLLKASVAALPRETSSADNSAQTLVDVQVGVEVGLSGISVNDVGPESVGAKAAVDVVYTGMSYFLKVTVTNNGGMDITDYEVAFIVDGNYIGSQLVTLAASESVDLWQDWTPDTAGLYIEVRAEGAVLTGEINPDDNAAVTSIDVESGTDVAVNTLASTPATPAYGNTITFTANVSNNGNLDLTGVTVLFDVNGTGIGMQSVDLAIGESATVEQTWAADQVGALTARASVSPLPYETYTANNTKTTPISVSGRDIGITAFTITPPIGSPLGKKGKMHTVKVTVKNNGTSAETFQLRLTRDGVQVGTTRPTVTALAKGASKVVSMISWTPAWALGTAPPTFLLRVEVGTSSGTTWNFGLLNDINPDNDAMEQSIAGIASIYDAAVTGVKTTSIPMVGKVTPVSVAVSNTGNEIASFYVDLYADGALVKSQLVRSLAVKASRTVSFVGWKPTATGNVELKAVVRGGVLEDTAELKTTAAVYVPVSLKLTSTPPTAKGQSVRIDVQLMDPTGKKTVALAGVTISVAVPAGVMAASATVTTDENGHAVLYVSSTKASAPVTITAAPGLARASLNVKF